MILLLMTFLSVSQSQERYDTYRPQVGTEFEECPDGNQLQDCQNICDKSGQNYCQFNGGNGQTIYSGCINHKHFWFCCNYPDMNNKNCVKTNIGGLFGACDSQKYGEWFYMYNTRGHVTCRHEDEEVHGGVTVE